MDYFRNWWLFLHVHWLWTRRYRMNHDGSRYPISSGIFYKRNWGPLRFLPLYLTDYLLAVLLGRGVQSLSRAFQLFGESHHWGQTGPILWGSKDLWKD